MIYSRKENLVAYQSLQKEFADRKVRDMHFMKRKVSPVKGVIQFRKTCKLYPRFIGTFEISKIIELMTYTFVLPPIC